jgi:hypothetical protein
VSARHPHRPPRTGRGFAALLVLALLWAQGLGLAHRVLHAPGAPAAVASAAEHDDALHHHAPQSAECRLYDQLAAGDAVAAAALVAVAALPPAAPRALPAAPQAGTLTLGYRARAPPLLA